MRLDLAAVTALLMVAHGAIAGHLVPVVNGDFELGSAGWILDGDAVVAGGTAKLGTYSATCRGTEPTGVSGSITTLIPPSFTRTLTFDYVLVQTMDYVMWSSLVVQAVLPRGEAFTLAAWNPNASYGTCTSASGQAVVRLAEAPPGSLLRLAVYQDGFGDPFFVQLDNVRFAD